MFRLLLVVQKLIWCFPVLKNILVCWSVKHTLLLTYLQFILNVLIFLRKNVA